MTVKTRPRYLVHADPAGDLFRITDALYGAPCGLPDASGTHGTLGFPEHRDALAWLAACADSGLPMTYTLGPSTDILAGEQTGVRAADVQRGYYVYDEARASWVPVLYRSRSDTAVHLFVEGAEDPITVRFDDIVPVCVPLTMRHG